jgi:aldose 1-epimerase
MSRVVRRRIGTTKGHSGQGPTDVFALVLEAGDLSAEVWSYGATLVAVQVPDRRGTAVNVVRRHRSLADYEEHGDYLGATIGRYANRIAGGRFDLDGVAYEVGRNDGPNQLHGGQIGFDQYVWHAEPDASGGASVVFAHRSPDGDEGFPGNLDARVRYTLREDSLTIDYEAVTDAPTVVGLTNHAYWNLAGDATIGDHLLCVHAEHYLPVDEGLIPLGAPALVAGTGFDLREPRRLGDALATGGFDHSYELDDPPGMRAAAELWDPISGRAMTVETNTPALQIYTANYLDPPHTGVCLETQCAPDSPNQPALGSAALRPGDTYRHLTRHSFTVR